MLLLISLSFVPAVIKDKRGKFLMILRTQRCENLGRVEGKKLCQCQGSCSLVKGQSRLIPAGQKGELQVLEDELSFGCCGF